MQKSALIGASIIAVVLLVLGSLTNVVGYQTVQSSNQNIINSEVDPKELLFQTILDIANNKEIQRIIIKSQINREGSFNPEVRFSIFNTPVLTKNQLKHMYVIGLMLSKFISKSRIHSMVEQYQIINQRVQKDITTIIERDATLKGEITQLSNSKCDCENENTTPLWTFPVLCTLLVPLVYLALVAFMMNGNEFYLDIMMTIGLVLHCFWYPG